MTADPSKSSTRGADREPKPSLAPWKQAPWPSGGDADRCITFSAVGAALTAWSSYEAALGRLFCRFMVGEYPSPAADMAFGAIRSFEARAQVLRSSGKAFFTYRRDDPSDQNSLTEILKIGQQFCERRNEIAHGIVLPYKTKDCSIHDETNGFCLFPSYYDSHRRDTGYQPEFCYSSVEIDAYGYEFLKLVDPVNILANKIIARAVTRRGRNLPRSPW
jgi:hypothetical protein